jgi:hypothetical protein
MTAALNAYVAEASGYLAGALARRIDGISSPRLAT